MSVTVAIGDPEEAADLLRASHALMRSLFPSESNHYLPVDALAAPNIRFLIARDGGAPLGCGALALKDGYGELKSMFVAPEARGKGIAEALMVHLETIARDEGVKMLRLETGSLLHAAHRLYERRGFTRRGPFGDYRDDPLSVFMEKPL